MIVAWLIFLKWINKMEYLVKSNTRWENGSFLRVISFDDIVSLFIDGEEDVDVDKMLDNVAHLNVNQYYAHEFFMNDVYAFKRIR